MALWTGRAEGLGPWHAKLMVDRQPMLGIKRAEGSGVQKVVMYSYFSPPMEGRPTVESTLLCFIHHRSIQEVTFCGLIVAVCPTLSARVGPFQPGGGFLADWAGRISSSMTGITLIGCTTKWVSAQEEKWEKKGRACRCGVNDFTHLDGFGVFVDSGSSQVNHGYQTYSWVEVATILAILCRPASLFECKERLLPQLFGVISFQGSPCGVFKCSFSAQDTGNVRQRNSTMLVRCVMSDGRNLWPSANTLFTLVHPKSLMKTHIFLWTHILVHRYSWFY